ncbi:butyrophilin subfamily 3 member A2-like isoform X2 [Notolabrus celidotus]|uniref:butyrophilin subfamily 3 member A2-like isoform X2 n=1 Tax=Notolabrus celidotus TaxID=1203425 RepID=UPI0014902DCF|nr:butyrophilin subfamily 3 member A2-like isoform X2 [Notolabrus celidotus]
MKSPFSPVVLFFKLPLLMSFLPVQLSVESLTKLICQEQPIRVLAGDDVILPCHLQPSISASSQTVVWTKPGLNPKYIHIHKNGKQVQEYQNPSYKHRTRLFMDELRDGNVSLKISSLQTSDAGTYLCILEQNQMEASVQLEVGAVSTPSIEVVSEKTGSLVLQCRSNGWYPEPEVLWLDDKGNILSAEHPETLKGPDGLYSVSSRVTVEMRESNFFTCRVHQRNIKQTRETQLNLSGILVTYNLIQKKDKTEPVKSLTKEEDKPLNAIEVPSQKKSVHLCCI